MGPTDKPCCAVGALRCIRQIPVKGILTGICMLDECVAEVKTSDSPSDPEIQSALLRVMKVYNYIPQSIEAEYARALLEEFHKPAGRP